MPLATPAPTTAIDAAMQAHIGRHAAKAFDWDAFPASRGFDELARGQMRYIGAGGSPRSDDPETLRPGAFSLSLVTQPPGRYAACHSHEIVEHFLVLQGRLTVGWAWDDTVIEVRLGPRDMVLNALGRPHGFRNDGDEPVLMSISVGSGKPRPPVYVCHPRDGDPARARRFGAAEGKVVAFDPASADPRHRALARHLVRHATAKTTPDPAGFVRRVYVGPGGAPPEHYRMEMIELPPGAGVRAYAREVEDAYFVLDGALTVDWVDGSTTTSRRLEQHDVILNPPGRLHGFRNDGTRPVTFTLLVGSAAPDAFALQPA